MFKSLEATVLALSIAWCASTLLALLAQRPAFRLARPCRPFSTRYATRAIDV
jgi:hypothetical protein